MKKSVQQQIGIQPIIIAFKRELKCNSEVKKQIPEKMRYVRKTDNKRNVYSYIDGLIK